MLKLLNQQRSCLRWSYLWALFGNSKSHNKVPKIVGPTEQISHPGFPAAGVWLLFHYLGWWPSKFIPKGISGKVFLPRRGSKAATAEGQDSEGFVGCRNNAKSSHGGFPVSSYYTRPTLSHPLHDVMYLSYVQIICLSTDLEAPNQWKGRSGMKSRDSDRTFYNFWA